MSRASSILPPVRITELGRKLLALLPALGEAQYYDVHDYESELDAGHEAIDKAVDAILQAPAEAHLGDLTLAARYLTVEGCEGNERCEAARAAIMGVLIRAAGLTEGQCDQHTYYVQAERSLGPLD